MILKDRRKETQVSKPKKHETEKYACSEEANRYIALALSVWESARMSTSPSTANAKKKEAVGWAVQAAKKVAEEEVDHGKTLAECLRIAAQVLMEKAEEIKESL